MTIKYMKKVPSVSLLVRQVIFSKDHCICEEGVREVEDGVMRGVGSECGRCGRWEAFQKLKVETPYVLNSFPGEEGCSGSVPEVVVRQSTLTQCSAEAEACSDSHSVLGGL